MIRPVLIETYFRAFCLADSEKDALISSDIDALFNSFTVVNRFLPKKLIKLWIDHNSWMIKNPEFLSPDEYFFLAANTYDRTKLILENLSKDEYFRKEKQNGMYRIKGSFSISDPDQRLDKIKSKINVLNIKFDFQNPSLTPSHLKSKKVKAVVQRNKVERIILRALSNHNIAPNPYRKMTPARVLTRSNSKVLTAQKTKSLSKYRSTSSIKQREAITLTKKDSVSALGLSVREDPYHITTLREAALITHRVSINKPKLANIKIIKF